MSSEAPVGTASPVAEAVDRTGSATAALDALVLADESHAAASDDPNGSTSGGEGGDTPATAGKSDSTEASDPAEASDGGDPAADDEGVDVDVDVDTGDEPAGDEADPADDDKAGPASKAKAALARERKALDADKAAFQAEVAAARGALVALQRDLGALERLRKGDADAADELGIDVQELTLAYAQRGRPEAAASKREKELQAKLDAQARQLEAVASAQRAQALDAEKKAFVASAAADSTFLRTAQLAARKPEKLYRYALEAAEEMRAAGRAPNERALKLAVERRLRDDGVPLPAKAGAGSPTTGRPKVASGSGGAAGESGKAKASTLARKQLPPPSPAPPASALDPEARVQRGIAALEALGKLTLAYPFFHLASLPYLHLPFGAPMAVATSTVLSAIYKELYPDGDLPKQVMYKADPFVGEVRKNTKFGGSSINFPLQLRGGANTGGTVADAQANTQPNLYVDFQIPSSARHLRHAVVQWERQAVRATLASGDRGAFVRGYQRLVDGQSYAIMQVLAKEVWGSGGQAMGQISTGSGTATVTLSDADTITNFEVGMVLQAASADPGVSGSGTVRTGSITVTGVNRETFQLTAAGNWSASITGLADGDFLFQSGDIVAGDYAVGGRGMRGVQAWVPRTAPSSTPFFGVNRAQDITRAAGYRLNAQGLPLTEAIRQLGMFLAQQGASCDRVYVSVRNWHRLMNEGHNTSLIMVGPKEATGKLIVGYDNIEIVTAAGKVRVLASNKCPNDLLYMFNLSDWELASLDEAPNVVRDDSLEFVRQTNANVFELRMVYDAALICYNPGNQGVAIVTPPSFLGLRPDPVSA